jgi:hypothetical protein
MRAEYAGEGLPVLLNAQVPPFATAARVRTVRVPTVLTRSPMAAHHWIPVQDTPDR